MTRPEEEIVRYGGFLLLVATFALVLAQPVMAQDERSTIRFGLIYLDSTNGLRADCHGLHCGER